MQHELGLWAWFFVGVFMYWLKRAYYMINPPNPVALGYVNLLQRAWVPLLVRFFADSVCFWLLFTPGFVDKALSYMGWTNWAWVVQMITQFSVFAAIFGFFVDGILDIAISKVPGIKNALPQMPGPLPQQAPADPEATKP